MKINRLIIAMIAIALFPALALGAQNPALPAGVAVNKEKNAYYGDLHLWSNNSMTGYMAGIRTTPEDAYHFARGEAVKVDGQPVARKSAPLDFLAVTDMAENMGLFKTLYDPDSAFSHSEIGRQFRDPASKAKIFGKVYDMMFMGRGRDVALLGLDPTVVKQAAESAWREAIDAANRNYRPGTS